MAKTTLVDRRTLGALILIRLKEAEVPKALVPYVETFRSAHEAFETAAQASDAAKKKRDAALRAVGSADTALDATIDVLADKMIGAGLGTRKKPFGGMSPRSPTALKNLPYKTEVQAIRALIEEISKKTPTAEVKKCLDASAAAADASEAALAALTPPQMAYDKARGARDLLLIDWVRAFNKLRVNAKAVWDDEPATYEAVFKAPEKVQRPVKKQKKGKPNRVE